MLRILNETDQERDEQRVEKNTGKAPGFRSFQTAKIRQRLQEKCFFSKIYRRPEVIFLTRQRPNMSAKQTALTTKMLWCFLRAGSAIPLVESHFIDSRLAELEIPRKLSDGTIIFESLTESSKHRRSHENHQWYQDERSLRKIEVARTMTCTTLQVSSRIKVFGACGGPSG